MSTGKPSTLDDRLLLLRRPIKPMGARGFYLDGRAYTRSMLSVLLTLDIMSGLGSKADVEG